MCFSWLNSTLSISTSLKVGNLKGNSQHLSQLSQIWVYFSWGLVNIQRKLLLCPMTEEKEGPWVLWSRMAHGIYPRNFCKVFLSWSRAIQRIKQKALVTLYPSRQVRGVPRWTLTQPSAWPGTGSDPWEGKRRAQGTELNQHTPTHVTALSQFMKAKVTN